MKQSVVIILTLQSYCFFLVSAIVVRDSEQGCPGFWMGKLKWGQYISLERALRKIKTREVTEVTAVTDGCGFVASGGKNFCLTSGGILYGLPGYPGYRGYPTCFCFFRVGYI